MLWSRVVSDVMSALLLGWVLILSIGVVAGLYSGALSQECPSPKYRAAYVAAPTFYPTCYAAKWLFEPINGGME